MSSGLEDRFQTLHEIVRAARRELPPGPWDYLVGGRRPRRRSVETARRSTRSPSARGFSGTCRPSTPRERGSASRCASPSCWLPSARSESFTPGGAATAAKAAARFGVPQMLSSACNPGLEATAQAADTLRIFQLYVRGDDAVVDDWVRRARDHGYRGFCLTVDSAYYSRRERDLARRFVKPWRASATGLEYSGVCRGTRSSASRTPTRMCRSSSRASPPRRTRRSPAATGSRSCTSRTTGAASSITVVEASRSCPRWSRPSGAARRCGSTGASSAARTS